MEEREQQTVIVKSRQKATIVITTTKSCFRLSTERNQCSMSA